MHNRGAFQTKEYNTYVNSINKTIEEIVSLQKSKNARPFLAPRYKKTDFGCTNIKDTIKERFPFVKSPRKRYIKSLLHNNNWYYTLDTLHDDTSLDNIVTSNNLKRIRLYLPDLNKELANVRRAISSYGCYDTLMSWSEITNTIIPPISGSYYLDRLTFKAKKEHQCWKEVAIPILGQRKFFPILLIFHTLIVLVLAFVTQLLISDKSVTEPL